MGDAVIVSAARTAIGTARKGTLVDVSAFDLGRYSVGEALKRSGIPSDDVDDIQLGESLQGGGDIARYTAVELGITNVPGVALNRHCASGMASVQGAAASIMAGMDKVVIAGGSESIFKIEGMDCREEVTILERRFKNLAGLEDFSKAMFESEDVPRALRRKASKSSVDYLTKHGILVEEPGL